MSRSLPPPPPPPTPRQFGFISTSSLRAMEIPPMAWLIEGVIPAQLVSTIVGASSAGKTWVCLSLIRAWATGEPWMGKYPARKCHVAFLDAEDSWENLKSRWESLEDGMGRLPPDAIEPSWRSDIGAFDVLEDENRLGLIEDLKPYDVCIVDSLSQTHGYDENSPEMRIIMQAWEEVSRAANTAVILCHHAGLDKTRGRGSTTIKDRSQSLLLLQRDAELPITYLRLDKNKRGPEIPHLGSMRIEGTYNGPVRLEFLERSGGGEQGGATAQKAQARAYVEQKLRGLELAQKDVVAELQAHLRCSRNRAYSLVQALALDGLLLLETRGRGSWVRLK